MTTTATASPATQVQTARRSETAHPVTLGRMLSSEWIKLRTLRSTYWIVALTMATWLLMTWAIAWSSQQLAPEFSLGSIDTVGMANSPIIIAQLVLGVLGALFITGEYSTGMIRSTFSAEPRRLVALSAKAIIMAVVAFVIGIAASALSTLLIYATVPGDQLVSWTQATQLRELLGAGLYCAMTALLALGIGAIVRNTAGSVAVICGLLFILPMLASMLPAAWYEAINKYLPTNAGSVIVQESGPGALAPWVGFAVFAAYAAVAVAAAAILLRRRDA